MALKACTFAGDRKHARFCDGVSVLLRPFPGVIDVAPDTDEMLCTVQQYETDDFYAATAVSGNVLVTKHMSDALFSGR
jgi:acetamidase/formamidase